MIFIQQAYYIHLNNFNFLKTNSQTESGDAMKQFPQFLTKPILFFAVIATVSCGASIANADSKDYDLPEHITEVYNGKEGEFRIDADVEVISSDVYTGTVIFSDISLEKGKLLYGDIEKWEITDEIKDAEALKYNNENIYLYKLNDTHQFYFDTPNNVPADYDIGIAAANNLATEAVNLLELNAEIQGPVAEYDDPKGIYSYVLRGKIQDIPTVYMSEVPSIGSLEITGQNYSYLQYGNNLHIENQEKAELLDFEEILDKAQLYAEAGYIKIPDHMSITNISLGYYIELTSEQPRFFPVWNFQVPSLIDGSRFMWGQNADDLFYINAVTGVLVKVIA